MNFRLDVYLHHVDETSDTLTHHLLRQILTQGAHTMSSVTELNAKLDAINDSVTGVAQDVADLTQMIADLKATGGASQADLDAVFAKVSGIGDRLSALDAQNPVVPPVEPTV